MSNSSKSARPSHHRTAVLAVAIAAASVVAASLALASSIAVASEGPVSTTKQEVCSGYDYKVEGLSGFAYLITARTEGGVMEWCLKAGRDLEYGFGKHETTHLVTATGEHEISHVAWNEGVEPTPTPTTPPTTPPSTPAPATVAPVLPETVAVPMPATVTVPTSVPAGDGSSAQQSSLLPVGLLVAGLIGLLGSAVARVRRQTR